AHFAARFYAGILADSETLFCSPRLFKCAQSAKATRVIHCSNESSCRATSAEIPSHHIPALLESSVTVNEVHALVSNIQSKFAKTSEHPRQPGSNQRTRHRQIQ